jgi:hypothetical protein
VEVQSNYDQQQQQLIRDVMEIVLTYMPLVEVLNGIVAEIDVITR